MTKKFLFAWLVVFFAWMAGSFVVHGALLHNDYAQLPNLFRPEAEGGKYFPLMILAHLILAAAFVWVYSRGVEATPWAAQGLRFGLAIAFLTVIPTYMIYYVVQPMPGMLVVKQILFDATLIVVLGVIVALMYRRPSSASS
jgi:hypothetical protein